MCAALLARGLAALRLGQEAMLTTDLLPFLSHNDRTGNKWG